LFEKSDGNVSGHGPINSQVKLGKWHDGLSSTNLPNQHQQSLFSSLATCAKLHGPNGYGHFGHPMDFDFMPTNPFCCQLLSARASIDSGDEHFTYQMTMAQNQPSRSDQRTLRCQRHTKQRPTYFVKVSGASGTLIPQVSPHGRSRHPAHHASRIKYVVHYGQPVVSVPSSAATPHGFINGSKTVRSPWNDECSTELRLRG